MGGKNPTGISFANVGNQILCLDTIKYLQQSLGRLGNSMTDGQESAISKECKKFIKSDPKLCRKYLSCTEEEQKWVLKYLSTGNGTMLYEMITRFDSLDVSPENGKFFLQHQFFSNLKDSIMTEEEYENVKKFYKAMKLENLGQLNKIYNFQDTIILCKIFEHCSSHLQNLFKFNPKKYNFISSFSGCVHRDKIVVLLYQQMLNIPGYSKKH